jgi:ribosomal protein S18 acetylase RimI-like enzyme
MSNAPVITVREFLFDSADYHESLKLRENVLRIPIGLRFRPGELNRDRLDIHIGAFCIDQLVGCVILSNQTKSEVRMRQVAVDPGFQKQGIGQKMSRFAEELARAKGFTEIMLVARVPVVPFYEGLGYRTEGEAFNEIGIPHQHMRKRL